MPTNEISELELDVIIWPTKEKYGPSYVFAFLLLLAQLGLRWKCPDKQEEASGSVIAYCERFGRL